MVICYSAVETVRNLDLESRRPSPVQFLREHLIKLISHCICEQTVLDGLQNSKTYYMGKLDQPDSNITQCFRVKGKKTREKKSGGGYGYFQMQNVSTGSILNNYSCVKKNI